MRNLFFVLLTFYSGHVFSQTWFEVVQPPPLSTRYDDISFINDSTGYTSQNGEVYRTIDRGNHWTLIGVLDSFPHFVRSIEFMDDTTGFIGLLSGFPLTGNIFKTIDAGLSWTLLTNMQPGPNDGICGMAHFNSRLIGVGTFGGGAWFYRTDDYGQSWVKSSLDSLMSGLVDCYMVNNDTLLVSGISDSASQYKASIIKSHDGGLTWQRVYLASVTNSYCWKMFFRPNGLGLGSVEFSTEIARTTDFGETWTSIPLPSTADNSGGVGLLNDTLGWVTNQGGYGTYETRDGGLTWDYIATPINSGNRMVVLDSVTILVSGHGVYSYGHATTGISELKIVEQPHDLLIHPNPVNDYIYIEALAETNTFGLLYIIDENGNRLKTLTRQSFLRGKNSFTLRTDDMKSGTYLMVWGTNERFLTEKFTVIKN